MYKPFSEIVKDELYDTECTFKTLNKIADSAKRKCLFNGGE